MLQDQDLVRRCLKGEDAAWESLLKIHTRKIYNLCYRFTGNTTDAEDLTQEIFIKVFESLRSFDPAQSQFPTWLSRVARNHLVDHYRRTRRDRATASLDDEEAGINPRAGPSSEPAVEVEGREKREVLQAALNRLSPDMREVVVLRDL